MCFKILLYLIYYILPVAIFTSTSTTDSIIRHLVQIILTIILASYTSIYYWLLSSHHTFHI